MQDKIKDSRISEQPELEQEPNASVASITGIQLIFCNFCNGSRWNLLGSTKSGLIICCMVCSSLAITNGNSDIPEVESPEHESNKSQSYLG